MPKTPLHRTPSAKVEGRDMASQGRTPQEKFGDLTKRLLVVPQDELQAEIEKYNAAKAQMKIKPEDR